MGRHKTIRPGQPPALAWSLLRRVDVAKLIGRSNQGQRRIGVPAAATKSMQESQAVMDRIADKKVVHKNMVSRTKSRLVTAIKALAA